MKKSKSLPKSTSLGKEEKVKPTTIDQVLGYKGENSYNFLKDPFDEESYRAYLNSMMHSELYAHAGQYGFAYDGNKKLIMDKLIDVFRKDRAQYKMPADANSTGERKDIPESLRAFLAGAR